MNEVTGPGQDALAGRSGTPSSPIALFTIVVLGAAMGNLSQTGLNAILTLLASDFGIGVDVAQWLTNIYVLSLGVSVTLSSHLSRRLGMRAFTILGLALFIAGCAVSAVAPNLAVILLGRVLQAFSTGFLMPQSQSIAMSRMPAGRQGTAMGIAGVAMGFAPNIGPTIGSTIANALGWRYFFWTMCLIPVILLVIAIPALRNEEGGHETQKLDIWSFALAAVGFGGLLTGLSLASGSSAGSLVMWIPLLAGAVIVALFMRRQRRVENPLIAPEIMRSKHYVVGFWLQNLLYGSFMGITMIIPLYVQGVLGGSSIESGTVLLPGAIAALVFNPIGGILGDKIGQGRVIRIGAVVYAAGALLALTFSASTPLWLVALLQCVRGSGVSLSMGSTLTWMLSELRGRAIGDGSSFTILVRQASASFGTALMVLATEALPDLFVDQMIPFRIAFGISAAIGVALLVLALPRTRR